MNHEESSTQPEPAPEPRPAIRRIFLSSTNKDLVPYRESVDRAIRRMRSCPEGMESFGAQPRTPVKQCLKRVSESDGLVVIVAHRYGWVPTHEEGGHDDKSITWIEVEEALWLELPVWAFLIDEKFAWSGLREERELTDPRVRKDSERVAQVVRNVGALADFKEWLQDKCTTDSFTTPEDLASKVTASLAEWVLSSRGNGNAPPASSRQPDSLTLYRDHLLTIHRDLVPFFSASTPRPLGEIYVDLKLESNALAHLEVQHSQDSEKEAKARAHPKLENLLRMDPASTKTSGRWIVLGDPGAGKSTLCRHLCSTLAEDPNGPVPVLVSLARWGKERAHPLAMTDRDLESTHPDHVAGELRKKLTELGRAPGRLWWLLDGLDEVSTEDRRWVIEALASLIKEFPHARLALTSRKAGFEPVDGDFHQAELRPLEEDARRELLLRWLPETGDTVWQRIQNNQALQGLAHNPLLLTLIAKLAGEEGGRLPQTRSEVYARSVLLLLERGQSDLQGMHAPGTAAAILPDLSLRLHGAQSESWMREAIDEQLGETLDADKKLDGRFRRAWNSQDDFLEELAFQSGLLAPRGSRHNPWSYLHRSLREHLAAVGLGKRGDDSWRQHLEAMERGKEAATHWGETLVMVAGHHAKPDELILGLAERDKELGLRAFEDAKSLDASTVAQLLKRLDRWESRKRVFEGLVTRAKSAQECVAMLANIRSRFTGGNDLYFLQQALARFADTHPEVAAKATQAREEAFDHLDAPDESLFQTIGTPDGEKSLWAEIPAGEFLMGSPDGEGYDFEKPQHEVRISQGFQAAIVPVTVSQFQAFDSTHNPSFEGQVPEQEIGSHPVVAVTWYEAVCFCRWLSSRFEWARGARLPTEAEWEYMCRAGTTSPWWCGDSKEKLENIAWFEKNNSKRTTHSVARKSTNSWGLYDVHGNVWEWCRDWYGGAYLQVDRRVDPTGPESGSSRVVRGGSFWSGAVGLRSAYRSWWRPDVRDHFLGFRIVLPAARQ